MFRYCDAAVSNNGSTFSETSDSHTKLQVEQTLLHKSTLKQLSLYDPENEDGKLSSKRKQENFSKQSTD